MKEEKKLVPKLQFPEFRQAGGWTPKRLKDACEVNPANSALPGRFVYVDLESVEAGKLITRKIIDKDEAPSRAQRLLQLGDVIFQIVRPYQRNNFHFKADEGLYYVASTGYAQLRAKDSAEFLFQAVHGDDFVDRVIAKCTGSSYPAINSSDLADIPLAIPQPEEQQKIADCQCSLDELITAQARKVDALKTHKKGLMQQLFPSDGEAQPRLRFPEFQDAGDWSLQPFGDFVTKSFYGTSSSTSEVGRYPVLRMGNMLDGRLLFSNLAYLDLDPESFQKIRLLPGDILLNRTNSLALVGKISMFDRDIECITASYIVTYRVDKLRINPAFCNLMLNTPQYQAKISALARPSVSQANINPTTFRKELVVSVPSLAEQQRIADCLTALDNTITAATQELETFKTHKKGLMQQLFPSAEAVES